jgi:hypothetical protein
MQLGDVELERHAPADLEQVDHLRGMKYPHLEEWKTETGEFLLGAGISSRDQSSMPLLDPVLQARIHTRR